jgi:uncharacterized protein YkwD
MIRSDMRLLTLFSLIWVLLSFGCSLINKGKTGDSMTETIALQDSIPLEYGQMDSTLVIADNTDTLPELQFSKAPLEYMGINEKAMIEEINLLRADPNAYIRFVDEYIQDFIAEKSIDLAIKQNEMKAVDELVAQLQYQVPLPTLKADEALYLVAKWHGLDIKEQGLIAHRGSDGSTPLSRIQDSTALIGAENLVAGGRTIRETVIMLLVDANDKIGRSHRKVLLDPKWKYVACYSAGKVGDLPNTWVQVFAYDDPEEQILEPRISLIEEEISIVDENSNEEEENSINISEVIDSSSKKANADESLLNVSENPASAREGEFSFMSLEEKAMIDEINLMRLNPKGYIPYVDAYVAEMKSMMFGGTRSLDQAANELKKELNSIPTLSRLQPHQKLYQVAKAHGMDNKQHNQLEHTGTDGRSSFDRVKDANLSISVKPDGTVAPNENLAGGENTVRNTVIALLIDDGIATRGHRRALLEPTWKYVACYKIGTIENLKDLGGTEDMDHCWVQFFAP